MRGHVCATTIAAITHTDLQEFSDCLHDADLGLTRKEINALMMEVRARARAHCVGRR